jgi:hypothetical protein
LAARNVVELRVVGIASGRFGLKITLVPGAALVDAIAPMGQEQRS